MGIGNPGRAPDARAAAVFSLGRSGVMSEQTRPIFRLPTRLASLNKIPGSRINVRAHMLLPPRPVRKDQGEQVKLPTLKIGLFLDLPIVNVFTLGKIFIIALFTRRLLSWKMISILQSEDSRYTILYFTGSVVYLCFNRSSCHNRRIFRHLASNESQGDPVVPKTMAECLFARAGHLSDAKISTSSFVRKIAHPYLAVVMIEAVPNQILHFQDTVR